MAACTSPTESSPPGTPTCRYSVLPVVTFKESMLAPWSAGTRQSTASPAGATPRVPIMGLTGKVRLSLKWTTPSSTRTLRM